MNKKSTLILQEAIVKKKNTVKVIVKAIVSLLFCQVMKNCKQSALSYAVIIRCWNV